MISLPLDLLPPILSQVNDTPSLLELCLVSRSFLPEAQRRLYDDVALSSSTIVPFCEAVTKPVSHPVGNFVRRLSLEISAGLSHTQLRAIAPALSRLPFLEALEFAHHPAHWSYATTLMNYKHPLSSAQGILTGFEWPFRLKTFASGFRMSDPVFQDFLQAQPGIERLITFTIAGPQTEPIRLPPGCLPNLKAFWSPGVRLDDSDPGRQHVIQYKMDVVIDVSTLEHIQFQDS